MDLAQVVSEAVARALSQVDVRFARDLARAEHAIAISAWPVVIPHEIKAALSAFKDITHAVIGAGNAAHFTGAEIYEEGADTGALLSRVYAAREIVLPAPPPETLLRLAAGECAALVEQAFTRALLWKKKIHILLDFEPPVRGGAPLARVADALAELGRAGVIIKSLTADKRADRTQSGLITEAEVLAASGRGEKSIAAAPGAIITPLARDAARELGIELEHDRRSP